MESELYPATQLICFNKACPNSSDSESGCSIHSVYGVDLCDSFHGSKVAEFLEYVVSCQVYDDIPSGDAMFDELGRDVFPARMKKIVEMAKELLGDK